MRGSFVKLACSAILASGLSACGGGSGGGVPISYPISDATSAFFEQPHTYTLTATVNGVSLQLFSEYIPRPDEIEPNLSAAPLKSFTSVEEVSGGEGPPERETSITYFSSGPFQFWGGKSEISPGVYDEAEPAISRNPMPEFSTVGQSGTLGTWPVTYQDELGNTIDTTSQMGWRLASATGDTALLCIETRSQLDDGIYGMDRCMRIDESGNALEYRVNVIVPQGVAEFR